jgi:A/G-specific adenine glycosylase
MELGALVCAPRQPGCDACPVRRHCAAHRQGRINQIPNTGKRARTTTRHFIALVAQQKGRILVRQRPPGVVNAQLWEFPNFELGNGSDLNRAIKKTWGIAPASIQPFCTVKHSITRYRITLEVFQAELKTPPGKTRQLGRWLTRRELEQLAFASAHKKILARLSP